MVVCEFCVLNDPSLTFDRVNVLGVFDVAFVVNTCGNVNHISENFVLFRFEWVNRAS